MIISRLGGHVQSGGRETATILSLETIGVTPDGDRCEQVPPLTTDFERYGDFDLASLGLTSPFRVVQGRP